MSWTEREVLFVATVVTFALSLTMRCASECAIDVVQSIGKEVRTHD